MDDKVALVPISAMPVMDVAMAVTRYKAMNSFVGQVLRENTDYGKVPGAGDKPALLKPGAEKLTTFFGLAPTFEHVRVVEDWTGREHDGEPFFYYLIKCRLSKSGYVVAEGDGSCNSHETKYRYRQGERTCPSCNKTAIKRSKYPPRNNPNAEPGWYCFDKAGGCGAQYDANDKRITEQQVGRILNPDIADQVNTILKMAEKRALIAATLIAVNASDYFTQDIEDLPGHNDTVIAGDFRIIQPEQDAPPAQATNGNDTNGKPASDAAFDAIPAAREERKQAPPPAANANGKGAVFGSAQKLANLRTPNFPKYAAPLAEKYPVYKTKAGTFDGNHMLATMLFLGYTEITDANIDEAFGKLTEHAEAKQAIA